MPDQLTKHYQNLLAGSYACVDRMVRNAYFRLGRPGDSVMGGSDERAREEVGSGAPHADGGALPPSRSGLRPG